MKNFISTSFLLLFILVNSSAQDKQWYVLDGEVQIDATLQKPHVISNFFRVDNLMKPDLLFFDAHAKNEILVIYENGTYFNSRFIDNSQASEEHLAIAHPLNIGLPFNSYTLEFANTSSSIKYLYWTNVYEGDENPDGLRYYDNSNGFVHNSIELDQLSFNKASTNHDIVPTNDVVLSLNLFSLVNPSYTSRPKDGENNDKFQFIEPKTCLFTVNYNRISVGNNTAIVNDFLTTNKVFANQSDPVNPFCIFPTATNVIEIQNEISFNSIHDFAHINFNASTELNDFSLESDTIEAIFEISSNCISAPLLVRENVRASHDPNFMKIDSVCHVIGQGDTTKWVNFHMQFQNTGDEIVDSFRLELPRNKLYDFNRIVSNGWFGGGITGSCLKRIELFDTLVSLVFPPVPDLARMDSMTYPNTIGYFKFSLPIYDSLEIGIDLSSSEEIHFAQSYTRFDTTRYAITDTIDCRRLELNQAKHHCSLCKFMSCRSKCFLIRWISRCLGCCNPKTLNISNHQEYLREIKYNQEIPQDTCGTDYIRIITEY